MRKEYFLEIGVDKRLRIVLDRRIGYYHVGLELLLEYNGRDEWRVVRSHDTHDGKGCHLHRHHPDGSSDERKLPDLPLAEAIHRAQTDLTHQAEQECQRYLRELRQYQEAEGL